MADTKNVSVCSLCALTPICKNQPQQSCPFLQLKDKQARTQSKQTAKPEKPRPSAWRKILRLILISMTLLLFVSSIIAAFIAGRYSTHPKLVSKLPTLSEPVEPGLSPEEVIHKFYDYSRLHEVDNLTQLIHPDFIEQHNYRLTSWINYAPTSLADLKEITLLSIQTEESATATVSLVVKEKNESGTIKLKKHDGEWRILDFSRYY